jgi:DNA topoisomerase-1
MALFCPVKSIAMSATPYFSHKDILLADRDYEKAASYAHLVYVNDRQPGISRVRKGKGFYYLSGGGPVREKAALERIRGLVIPPAWTKVWICPAANGHIQATGIDVRGRKQYRYHALWNSLRRETKFHRLYEFGKNLPVIRGKMEADLRSKGLTREKVLATVISLIERTYIRVGSNEYEKLYGSYGLTTMKNKHVTINGDKMVFSFTGKKGVHHDITLQNKRLARMVGQCRDIPGKELFQYYEEDGSRKSIDSGMVNHYIKDAAGGLDFTAKDFRTWAGSLHALQEFRMVGEAADAACCKKNVVAVLDAVSRQLGNTRTVCRKYYVHPGLIRLYEENKLVDYLGETAGNEEEILMKILASYIRTTPLIGG